MKFIFCLIIFVVITSEIYPRQIGETEITTDEGIEVYQEEKFYLLKKNVKIISDSFLLKADEVKINFEENLYDITILTANGNVTFDSEAFKTIVAGSPGQVQNITASFLSCSQTISIQYLPSTTTTPLILN